MVFGSLSKKQWPIRVIIIRRYANALKFEEDRGAVITKEIKTENGVISSTVLVLKNNNAEFPAPDISFYHDIDNERVLYLFQYEREVFFPCKVTNEKISYFVPEVIVDEQGNKIVRMKEVELFVPKLNVQEIDEKTWSYWLASRIELANRMFRRIGFWEKWGGLIMLGLFLVFGAMLSVVGYHQYSSIINSASENLGKVADALNKIADKLIQAQNTSIISPPPISPPPY